MARPGQWTVRLTHLAEADFQGIVAWTARHFSDAQADDRFPHAML